MHPSNFGWESAAQDRRASKDLRVCSQPKQKAFNIGTEDPIQCTYRPHTGACKVFIQMIPFAFGPR